MSLMQPVRGTHDLLFDDMRKHRFVLDKAAEVSRRYGFEEIKTPIFEFSHVFSRTLGDASDIVTKEMYTFTDKGGDLISLRPEGTASIMRALISEGLAQKLPLKFFYEGPMFRYERPQKGRYRQFYQIGVELLGTDSPEADIEVLSLADNVLKSLGVSHHVHLEINSIGDKESRDHYRAQLVEYYRRFETSLSEDSRKRLALNPLRILDSKDKKDIEINLEAPKITEHLNTSSREKFDFIQNSLSLLGLPYKVNPQLVRGLDYYCHLVFEFKTSALGSQDAVLSGGRYDGLAEMMGGPSTPAVGWAAGVERLCLLLPQSPLLKRPIALIPLGDTPAAACRQLAHHLRREGFVVDLAYGGNLSNRMKKAAKQNAVAAVIAGDDEVNNNQWTLKILDTGEQLKVQDSDLKDRLLKLQGQ